MAELFRDNGRSRVEGRVKLEGSNVRCGPERSPLTAAKDAGRSLRATIQVAAY